MNNWPQALFEYNQYNKNDVHGLFKSTEYSWLSIAELYISTATLRVFWEEDLYSRIFMHY